MKTKHILSILLCTLLGFSACEKDNNNDVPKIPASISGLVEKGPFVAGSEVKLAELDENMQPTGRNFATTISSNDGAFTLDFAGELESRFVNISVSGYYYNEVKGQLSDGTITLSAIADVSNSQTCNVNLLTHLEKKRVERLVKDGTAFSEAKKIAQKELLATFGIEEQSTTSESMSIVNGNETGDMLMAISCILQGSNTSEAQFTELLQWFISDFETDGTLSNTSVTEAIKENSAQLRYSIKYIKEALKKRYAELGKTIEPGDFENYIDFDGNGVLNKDEDKEAFNTENDIRESLNEAGELVEGLMRHIAYFDAAYANVTREPNDDWRVIYNHNIGSDHSKITKIWDDAYNVICKANSVLASLGNNTLATTQKRKNTYAGTSYTYRAYAYLLLSQWFGDVPLDLEGNGKDILFNNIPRSRLEAVLDQVEDDLQEAIKIVPAADDNYELARLLLLRRRMLLKDYSSALDFAGDLVNSGDKNIGSGILWKRFWAPPVNSDIEQLTDTALLISLADEVYLYLAECHSQMGDENKALEYIHLIESFYKKDLNADGLVNADDLTISSDNLIYVWRDHYNSYDYVMQLEISAGNIAGQQMSALIRFSKAEGILGIPDYKTLLPIPQSAMEKNPSLTQNPGY